MAINIIYKDPYNGKLCMDEIKQISYERIITPDNFFEENQPFESVWTSIMNFSIVFTIDEKTHNELLRTSVKEGFADLSQYDCRIEDLSY